MKYAIQINGEEKNVEFENKETTIDFLGNEFVCKRNVTLEQMQIFAGIITSVCVGDGDGYSPELFDFAVRIATVSMFTNITLPADASESYDLLYMTDLYGKIMDCIDISQYNSIVKPLFKKIAFIADYAVDKVKDEVESVSKNLIDEVGEVAKMLEGVDLTSLNKVVEMIESAGFDEKKIVDAVLSSEKFNGAK